MSKKQPPNKPKKATEKQQRRTTYQFRLYPTKKQIRIVVPEAPACSRGESSHQYTERE